MNNCAIICEYNPFHSGHKYQLDRVRDCSPSNIVCIMSGQFVQSATPSFCDKTIRAECALRGGADAVIELPTVFATASAQTFAEGAIKIISEIKNISHIAMGATADRETILRISDIKIKHEREFKELLAQNMKIGKSYNAASVAALCELFGKIYTQSDNVESVLTEPNNILCIEYVNAVHTLAANIEPIIIQRRGALHNSVTLDAEHISATAIRNSVENGQIDIARKFIPFCRDKIFEFRQNHYPDMQLFKKMTLFSVKSSSTDRLSKLRDCSEGMEFLIKNSSRVSDYDKCIDSIIGKRYSKKRINRIFLNSLLNIDKSIASNRFCTRLLACRNGFDFSTLPRFVKTNNADIKAAAAKDKEVKRVLKIDETAATLYNTLCGIDGDYYNYSLVKL